MLLSELEECIPDKSGDVEQTMEAKELGKLLNRFLGTLEVSDRRIFLSRYYEALTAPQIAEKYGYTARQVKYRLEKLRMELNGQWKRRGFAHESNRIGKSIQ